MANVQLRENLRNLRRRHNFTQLQISNRLNISRQAYSNYETGKRIPDIDILIRLADIYGLSLEQLIALPCTEDDAVSEGAGPYFPGMLIENGDTIYLTKEEVTLLLHYRNASGDDRRLAQKVLNISDN